MNGSVVTPKTAGIESTAKRTSETSTTTSASSSGVTTDEPSSRPAAAPADSPVAPGAAVMNFSPSYTSVDGRYFFVSCTTAFCERSSSSSSSSKKSW